MTGTSRQLTPGGRYVHPRRWGAGGFKMCDFDHNVNVHVVDASIALFKNSCKLSVMFSGANLEAWRQIYFGLQ